MILLPSDGLSTNFDESENSDNALKHTRIHQIVAFQPLLQFIRMSTQIHCPTVVQKNSKYLDQCIQVL